MESPLLPRGPVTRLKKRRLATLDAPNHYFVECVSRARVVLSREQVKRRGGGGQLSELPAQKYPNRRLEFGTL